MLFFGWDLDLELCVIRPKAKRFELYRRQKNRRVSDA
jgi:hypothetical protein